MDLFYARMQKNNDDIPGETLRKHVAKGIAQEGVLSLLLWSLIVDDLPWELNSNDY
jgi:hypothetical protein